MKFTVSSTTDSAENYIRDEFSMMLITFHSAMIVTMLDFLNANLLLVPELLFKKGKRERKAFFVWLTLCDSCGYPDGKICFCWIFGARSCLNKGKKKFEL